jgi:putative endonuclease
VYVLECADGSYYTGVTNNLTRRLGAHRAGKASKYTRGRLPVRLACNLGSWPTPGPALKLEARIKAMTRTQKQALLLSNHAKITRLPLDVWPVSTPRRPGVVRSAPA